MRFLRAMFMRLGVPRWSRRDDEITEELRAHLEMLVEEYQRAGHSAPEARRRATAHFGSLTAAAEAYRDRRGVPTLEHWMRDCRYAVRSLNRTRLLSISMVLVLALGIGLVTTVVTIFHATVWRPLAVPEPERVVKLALVLEGEFDRRVEGHVSQFSYPEYELYRGASRTLAGVAAVRHDSATWRHDGVRRGLAAAMVTGNYFSTLQVRPALGRLLAEADRQQPVVVISHRLWTHAFAGNPSALGISMVIDRVPYTVIGVAERAFVGTELAAVEIWLPLEGAAAARGYAGRLADSNLSWLQVVARLAPEASLATASAEARVIAARFDASHPGRRTTIGVTAASALDAGLLHSRERSQVVGAGLIVGVLGALLLFICTSNAAALLLARSAVRQREIALRLALGAGGWRIAQQVFAESLLVALCAAVVGLLLCTAVLRAAAHLLPVPAYFEGFVPDAPVLFVAMLSAFGAAVLFGLAPAVQASRADPLPTLKQDGTTLGPFPARARHWLVSAQIAVALVLLIVSALLARGIEHALRADPGFSLRNLYAVTVDVPASVSTATDRPRIAARLLEGLRAAGAGVEAGLAAVAPFSGRGFSAVRPSHATELSQVSFNIVDAGYFRALGVSFVAGRPFTAQDGRSAVVVNARLARTFWKSEQSAIGQSLAFPDERSGSGSDMRTGIVVGVVPTLQSSDPGVPDPPTLYVPVDADLAAASFVVRSLSRPVLQRVIDGAIGRSDAAATVVPIEQRLFEGTAPARAAAAITVLIGVLALLVASAGIYGIVAHSVVSRTHEIGIRVALGASRPQVLHLVLESSVRAVVAGAALGSLVVIVVGAAASRSIQPLLLGVEALDPVAISLAMMCLSAIALFAAYLPARRALGVDPVESLRHL